MAAIKRTYRVADEIQKTLVFTLRTKIRDPRLKWINITAVEMSKDLSVANVFFSSLEKQEKIEDCLKALVSAIGFFRKNLAAALNLRVVPTLRFFYDNSAVYGEKMDDLIQKSRQQDKALIQNIEEDSEVIASCQKKISGFTYREKLR